MRGRARAATAVILPGILPAMFLLSQARDDAFCASDAPVKSLLARPFAAGRPTPVLERSDEACRSPATAVFTSR